MLRLITSPFLNKKAFLKVDSITPVPEFEISQVFIVVLFTFNTLSYCELGTTKVVPSSSIKQLQSQVYLF